jgi:hypothetical protein
MHPSVPLLFGSLLFALAIGSAQTQVIPQVADGGGWQTTLVLTNTTANPAAASLTFYKETANGATQIWSLVFQEGSSTQGMSLAGGATRFLHTAGGGGATSVGWGQLTADPGVVAYAIFTQRVSGRQDQDGTAGATTAASRVVVPFDNTSGYVTAIAIVNPASSSQSISAAFRTANGAVTQGALSNVPARGHMAFPLPLQFGALAGQSGLAEFYSASGSFALIALRFNATGAFTTAPVYLAGGPPIIGSGSSGGTLPAFTLIKFSATFTPKDQPSFHLSAAVFGTGSGTYSFASAVGTPLVTPIPWVASFAATWAGIAVSSQTATFSAFQAGPSNVMVDSALGTYAIASASMTLTLSPQGTTTGNLTGSMTLVSSLATLDGAITGTYVATQ